MQIQKGLWNSQFPSYGVTVYLGVLYSFNRRLPRTRLAILQSLNVSERPARYLNLRGED
ncbi:hypothetical protein BDZ45DRAFT_673401 [Acephala macrosclerotiorum]|nr:hypothetical protein BDZ45DRAFT_673401 [Acephala macrosclerotiorum]